SFAILVASAFEAALRIAQPPITSLLSVNGPSVTVIFPFVSRTRTPSLLGKRPPVSTSVPSLSDCSTNLPIASIKAAGGGPCRYDSECRMNVRYLAIVFLLGVSKQRRTRPGRIDISWRQPSFHRALPSRTDRRRPARTVSVRSLWRDVLSF